MATAPRLVNKQFNTPIGLYSQQNIQETLNKQSQVLQNGAVGIDFNNPMNSKPANLANSAVLRMLEEEEQRQRSGQPGSVKRVAWPPPAEENGDEPQEAPVRQATPVKLYQSPALTRLIPIEREHAPPKSKVYSPQPPQLGQGFTPVSAPIKPISPQPAFGSRSPLSPQPVTPTQTFPPPLPDNFSLGFQKSPPQPSAFARPAPKAFTPSFAPPSAKTFSPEPLQEFNLLSSQTCAPVSSQGFGPVAPPAAAPPASISPRGWAPVSSPTPLVALAQNQFVEPPPSTVILRPVAPVHLPPPPVVASQPIANSFRGGVNMRGDQKWPPQTIKDAVAAENDARVQLAKGPACRPRKVKKDYSKFFAQNALPHNYPGYRAPPGTQHFDDASGQTQF